MGNSSSTNVFLTVNDSWSTVTAGSTLSGEVSCPGHALTNDVFSVSGVTLYFIGKEDVEVRYTQSGYGNKDRGAKKYKAAKRYIIRSVIPLRASLASVGAGRYPFEFRVPDHLPSSMYCKDGNGGYCSIKYKVKLRLPRRRDQEVPIKIVAKPPSAVPIPSSADPMTTRIQMMYCIPQGSVTWATGVDDTRVGVGEQVTINLGMKNESLAKMERVTAKLKQTVEWHSSGHSSVHKATIRSSSFIKTDSMDPWSKDQLRLVKRDQPPPPGARPLTVYEEVLETVQEGNNKVVFPIPEYVYQSYSGRLIRIHHYISVKAVTPSGLTNPKVHIPIEIVSPRNTPPRDIPILAAQAIPVPSAPPIESHDLDASDASTLYLPQSFAVGVPVVNAHEKEVDLDDNESSPLTGAGGPSASIRGAALPSRGEGRHSNPETRPAGSWLTEPPSGSQGSRSNNVHSGTRLAFDASSWLMELDGNTLAGPGQSQFDEAADVRISPSFPCLAESAGNDWTGPGRSRTADEAAEPPSAGDDGYSRDEAAGTQPVFDARHSSWPAVPDGNAPNGLGRSWADDTDGPPSVGGDERPHDAAPEMLDARLMALDGEFLSW